MTTRIHHAGLAVDPSLYAFINHQVIPGTGVDVEHFWQGFAKIVSEMTPINRALLVKRDDLQVQIDQYHQAHSNFDFEHYKQFLQQIGYLKEAPNDVTISTQKVEPEIANMAGPQLVVPVSNARFALNAANARWGSLYDALYGTDAISYENGREVGNAYNPVRGNAVIDFGREFLDQALPLSYGSHKDASDYAIVDGKLIVTLNNVSQSGLQSPEQLVGYNGTKQQPKELILQNNGLHIIIQFDENHQIGKQDSAHIKDVVLESALTTIMDCEDSVAAVDAEDKLGVYSNWLGLNKGDLSVEFEKGGKVLTRALNPDKSYVDLSGKEQSLKGRSLMLVRNVGHLMTNPAIIDKNGDEIFEGIMDAVITSLIALHDLRGNGKAGNSRADSINIVKPKMHGPEEVAYANTLFSKVENLLNLPENTLKMGIMDEERRTSVNLAACIFEAKERVIFINTGFLDRTGDEIHTSMLAGPMLPKEQIKAQKWIGAYENNNVDVGLACGLSGKAQIGKGMWPMPDEMAKMLAQKTAHVQSGANTAWVPSPTAATLHALHYHQQDVFSLQQEIKQRVAANVDDILCPPLHPEPKSMTQDDIQNELNNNAQGILGYMVRWVEQGVGCSKVPDINNIGLMEDRATLRISSQHMTNWLCHGICNEKQIVDTLQAMAKVVDKQNEGDENYRNMADNYAQSVAFQAALELVLTGTKQPNGYTEPVLHRRRLEFKAAH
ncbi:malate synthase G [Pseudoalteromonas piratica]|uniref:Malate synthase G n=1 Tax=Pseudoalteromonas piratica TaxID=1348114 RepID=A0A0A7EIN2_9GAMM|nr:malate synthase G [Pseudoalteromonas piratica]AIY66520.1 malate synthase [Pseudoalteromonas piratica]